MVFNVQLNICIQFWLNTHIVHACQFRNVYAHGFDGLYRLRCCGSRVLIAIEAFCKQNTHAHIEVRMIGRTSCSGEQHTHAKHIYTCVHYLIVDIASRESNTHQWLRSMCWFQSCSMMMMMKKTIQKTHQYNYKTMQYQCIESDSWSQLRSQLHRKLLRRLTLFISW